ncbi:MAG: hypothetical protein QOE59_191 [Actinomycetota bacterium]|jgi:hypothetical protein|nr:hypothetical protein [Actinomycetota bacterium]
MGRLPASVPAEVFVPDGFEVLGAADAGGELEIMIETLALANSNGVNRIVCQTTVGLSARWRARLSASIRMGARWGARRITLDGPRLR